MKQPLIVEMDDGTSYDVDADARDIRAWEAQYDASWFATPTSFTNLAQVAYLAGRRTGILNGAYPSYEEFDAHCVDARGRPGPVVGRPTRAGRTAASSASSPATSAPSRRSSSGRARK
jgi:hypothetical protein